MCPVRVQRGQAALKQICLPALRYFTKQANGHGAKGTEKIPKTNLPSSRKGATDVQRHGAGMSKSDHIRLTLILLMPRLKLEPFPP